MSAFCYPIPVQCPYCGKSHIYRVEIGEDDTKHPELLPCIDDDGGGCHRTFGVLPHVDVQVFATVEVFRCGEQE